MRSKLSVLVLIAALGICVKAQTAVFTYQGRLTDMSTPANGTYQMQFALYASATEGGPGIATVTNNAVSVGGGIFTVGLDFGAVEFTNSASRWLEIRVKRSTDPPTAPFIILTPRQEITSAPYSLHADVANSSNSLTTACDECVTDSHMASVASFKITGTLSDAQVSDNLTINGGTINNTVIGGTTPTSGTFTTITGNGAGITNVSAANLVAGSSVVSNAEVDDNLTINGGAINNTSIGGVTRAAGSFTTVDAGSHFAVNGQTILSNAGSGNLFAGVGAGDANTTGSSNSFLGRAAGSANIDGDNNTFLGHTAGNTNTTGSSNTIIGQGADVASGDLSFATALGAGALATSSNSVTIGRPADKVFLQGSFEPFRTIRGSVANHGESSDTNSTPNVTNRTMVVFRQSNDLTVTNLIGGVDGQCVVLLAALGDSSFRVIVNDTFFGNFVLNGNWNGGWQDTLTVCHFEGRWYERSRSKNNSF